MSFIRFLFLALSILAPAKAWALNGAPLVYIYCDYITSDQPLSLDPDSNWATLVRHFEGRELINKRNTLSESPKFQECVRQNAGLFETGEILFEGRTRLQESLGVLKENGTSKTSLVSSDFSFENTSLLGEYFSGLSFSESGTWAPQQRAQEMEARQRKYSVQWQAFLDAVREKMPMPNPSISLK